MKARKTHLVPILSYLLDVRRVNYGFSAISYQLNEGDEGLKEFFRKVHSVLKTGGAFVLEPQPWESFAES